MEISIFLAITLLTYCFSIQRFILQAKVALKLQLALASVLLGAWTKNHCLPSLSLLWDGSRNFSFISENIGEVQVDKYRSLHVLRRRFSVSLSTTVVFSGTLPDNILLQKSNSKCMKNFATHDYLRTQSLFKCRFITTTRNLLQIKAAKWKLQNNSKNICTFNVSM